MSGFFLYVVAAGVLLMALYYVKVFFRTSRLEMDLDRLGSRMSSLQESMRSIQDETKGALDGLKSEIGDDQSESGKGTSFKEISGEEAAEIIEKEGAFILDVRSAEEFEGGHVPNAHNIPLNELRQRINEISNEGCPIVVFCERGQRSGAAGEMLARQGVENVSAVSGGMRSWPGEVAGNAS